MHTIWNFWDIMWGKDEARGDKKLRDYFVPVPAYQGILDGDIRYVIGRKGSGKTAVAERIRIESENDPLMFYSSLSLRNFPIRHIRDLREKSQQDKSQFVPIWTFLLCIELISLIIQDEGATPPAQVDLLRDFYSSNFGDPCFDFSKTLTVLSSRNAKVGLSAGMLSGEGGAAISKGTTKEVHFQQATNHLISLIRSVQSESTFYVFMDELDEGYRAGDKNLRLVLLALIRATEDLAITFEDETINFRPLLLLRSDIYDRLEDNDLNKIDDFVERLKWTSTQQVDYNIKDIVNARCCASLNIPDGIDPWNAIAEDTRGIPRTAKSLWKYTVNRTLDRPRDIVKFMKFCKKIKSTGKLTFKEVLKAENDFSAWLYNELRDEIHSHLPIWRESLQCITTIGRAVTSADVIAAEFLKNNKISSWMKETGSNQEDILQTLFDFGIIGNLDDRKRWLFKYKDSDLPFSPAMKVIVHYGFNKKLRLR